ncbi:uncharacterized protein PAC_13683 [Phialocephala subalpina]|uniref:Zn(2)-C6 fungal-type domain-containing protein n=1 Tax=Phialocephala subalpina TaxID=576137 RepID=A0A1L7XFN7_9HELO|nr:uncharacterized protein PAC_13683 [Phialocephala subalpina]
MSEEPTKKRRLASGQACISCKKRKGRCDGERPTCGPCRSRLVTCQFSETTSGLERSSKWIAIGSTPSTTGTHVQPPGPGSTPSNGPSTTDGMGLLWSAASDMLGSSSQIVPPPMIQPSIPRPEAVPEDSLPSRAASPEPDGYFGDSSTFAFVSKVQPRSTDGEILRVPDQRNASKLPSINNISVESGRLPASSEPSFELPDRQLADDLVDAYFEHVHPFYPFIHEGSFRVEYERMWTRFSTPLSSSPPSWHAILNLFFARGCEFSPAIPEQERSNATSPFIARARSIIFSEVFRRGNLELVQALLLMCQYLQGTLEFNECWNLVGLMIRTAISIGLHLNPEDAAFTPIEKEVRKRAWWGCFILDRTLSMKFGRPPSIQAADDIEVPYPLSVDDQYIVNDSVVPRQPSGRPSITAFFIHTIKLVKIVDSILRELYTTKNLPAKHAKGNQTAELSATQSHIVGNAVLLDGDLRSWWHEVPIHLRPNSNTADGPAFQSQKIVMQIRYLQIRLLLQRQLLVIFSRQDIEDDFLRAVAIAGSRACISGACESIKLIHTYHHRGLLNSLWYNLHYVFTSMGVLLALNATDKAKLDILGYNQNHEILALGTEFLQSASKTSTLAAKYLSVLKRAITRNDNSTGLENASSVNTSADRTSNFGNFENSPPTSSASQPILQSNGVDNLRAGIDLDGMTFDELLLCTGFTQDIRPFEYSSGGFML